MSTATTARHLRPSAPPDASRTGPGFVDDGPADPVRRETMWYDHAVGVDDPAPAPWVTAESAEPEPGTPFVARHALATPGAASPLPTGLWRHLEGTGPASAATTEDTSLLDLATLATSPVRRDPDDPYNDHRAYASPRCLFPVHALTSHEGEWQLLDPDRRRIHATGVRAPVPALALTGRYDVVPASYGWFAGSLVAIETGILARQLGVVAAAVGHRLSMQLPTGADPLGSRAVWNDPHGWSPPVLFTTAAPHRSRPAALPADFSDHTLPVPAAGRHERSAGRDVALTYGAHRFPPMTSDVPSGLPSDLPALDDPVSWAEVMWRRSAGRMPRGLWGFRVSDHGLGADDVAALGAWVSCAAPRPCDVDSVTVRAVVRDVRGIAPGVYHWTGEGLVRDVGAGPDAVEQVGDAYLYDSSAQSRNDMRRAPLLWVLTARPREHTRRLGPSGWSALHLTTGWMTHGLCLGAAQRRLLARPVRAFDERALQSALDLDPDEMVCLAVVVGHHQPHGGLQIDLRS